MHQPALPSSPANPVFWASDFHDPVLECGSVGSISPYSNSGSSDLRIMWGRFYKDSIVCEATEGSGSLSVNRGTEITPRVMRCVSNQNFSLLSSDRKSMGQVFRTAIYADGTAVDIVTPRPIPVLNAVAGIDVSYDCDNIATTTVDAACWEWDSAEVVLETEPFRSTFARDEISALE